MIIVPGFNQESIKADEKRRFGLWLFYDSLFCKCSCCDAWANGKPDNYCGHCGAVMVNKADAVLKFEMEIENIKDGETTDD